MSEKRTLDASLMERSSTDADFLTYKVTVGNLPWVLSLQVDLPEELPRNPQLVIGQVRHKATSHFGFRDCFSV